MGEEQIKVSEGKRERASASSRLRVSFRTPEKRMKGNRTTGFEVRLAVRRSPSGRRGEVELKKQTEDSAKPRVSSRMRASLAT